MFTLTEAEKSFEFDFEMAALDLEAERYLDAENRFSQIGRQITSPTSYLGIGLTRLGRYIDGETNAGEILYCFKKARDISDNKNEISQLAAQVGLRTIEQLYLIIIDSSFQNREAEAEERKAKIGILISSAIIGATKNGSNGKIVGGSLVAYSTLKMFAQRKNQLTAKLEVAGCLLKIVNLQHEIYEFLEGYGSIKDSFSEAFAKIQEEASDVVLTDEQKTKNKIEASNTARSSVVSDNSPFYNFRDEALAEYEKKEYTIALNNIKQALDMLPEDVELINLREQCFNKSRSSDKKVFWLIFAFGLMVLGFVLGKLEREGIDIPTWPTWIILIYPFVGTFINDNRHKNRIEKYSPS